MARGRGDYLKEADGEVVAATGGLVCIVAGLLPMDWLESCRQL